MSTTEPLPVPARPRRADARRNYEKVLEAAREAFAEGGAATSLEEIARRAGVGIGTLYRHFPSRQALLEAVYVDELAVVCRTAGDLERLDPWDAFATWIQRFVGYMATKQALAPELLEYIDRDAPLFQSCRAALVTAAEPLLHRAQRAGAVRADTDLAEVMQIVGAVAKIQGATPEQVQHLLQITLDGLRAPR